MRSSINGFTLLELLCALTLSTLLMVALLGVVGGLAKTEKTLNRHLSTPEWQRRLTSQLEQDLRATSEFNPIPNGFRLTGFLDSNSKSGSLTWKKGSVEYLVEESPLGPLLLRREYSDDISTKPRYKVLIQQVKHFSLLVPGNSQADYTLDDQLITIEIPKGPPPSSMRLVFYTQQDATPYDQILISL